MSLEVTFPDVEHLITDLLTDLIEPHEDEITVGVGVPDGWSAKESPPHLQVIWDGTPAREQPIIAHTSVRIVARAATTTQAKRLAALAEGLLIAHPGGGGIAVIRALAGVLPARDPVTRAELASVSLRVTVRSNSIEAGGS